MSLLPRASSKVLFVDCLGACFLAILFWMPLGYLFFIYVCELFCCLCVFPKGGLPEATDAGATLVIIVLRQHPHLFGRNRSRILARARRTLEYFWVPFGSVLAPVGAHVFARVYGFETFVDAFVGRFWVPRHTP